MSPLDDALARVMDRVLTDRLGPAIRDELSAALPGILRRAAIPPLLTTAELAELTGWSSRHIEYLRSRRRLPYVKVGRSVRFKTADVEALLDDARIAARSNALPGGQS